MDKKWYASKTLWFNLVAVAVLVLGAFGYTGEVPAEWGVYVPAIVALVNFVLRLITKEPIERTLT